MTTVHRTTTVQCIKIKSPFFLLGNHISFLSPFFFLYISLIVLPDFFFKKLSHQHFGFFSLSIIAAAYPLSLSLQFESAIANSFAVVLLCFWLPHHLDWEKQRGLTLTT